MSFEKRTEPVIVNGDIAAYIGIAYTDAADGSGKEIHFFDKAEELTGSIIISDSNQATLTLLNGITTPLGHDYIYNIPFIARALADRPESIMEFDAKIMMMQNSLQGNSLRQSHREKAYGRLDAMLARLLKASNDEKIKKMHR